MVSEVLTDLTACDNVQLLTREIQNLSALPEIRRKGPPGIVAMSEPFKGSELKQGITFIKGDSSGTYSSGYRAKSDTTT